MRPYSHDKQWGSFPIFLSFFLHISQSRGVSPRSSCYGSFPLICWCYGGPLHLVIILIELLIWGFLIWEDSSLYELLLGTPLFVYFERNPLTFFLLSGMTHPIVDSSSLGGLLPWQTMTPYSYDKQWGPIPITNNDTLFP